MKRNKKYFLSLLFATSLLVVSCEDDDGSVTDGTESNDVPGVAVVTASEFETVQEAIETITSVSENTFITDTGTAKQAGTAAANKSCAEVTFEESEGVMTVTIDYGTGCEIDDENTVSGRIILTYNTQITEGEDVAIETTVDSFMYNDITVSGSAITTYNTDSNDGIDNFTFSTESDYSFEWPDGLTATSTDESSTETIFEVDQEENDFQFYWLTTGEGGTTFSNGDVYSYEITMPLRSNFNCRYIVSGVITVTENSDMVTTDYGDGACDSIATETDQDGNETTIDLDDVEDGEDEVS